MSEPPGVATLESADAEGFEPDVIVVGGGSAGAAAARRLVDRDVRVLLLEAGGPDVNPAIHDPGRLHELWLSEEDWAYETVPQAHASDRRLAWPRGRVLGGSSCLNAMIWVRGARADYDTWAYLGAEGWGWDDVLPVFERIERRAAGDVGIVNILTGYDADPIHQAIVAAAQECGIPFNADYNGATQDGVSYMQYSIENGIRHSTAAAYLRPIAGHPNLRVVLRARASRLLFEGTRCVGVEFVRDGKVEREARARGDRVRRNDRLGAAAAALGRRAGRRAARARDRGRGRPARRGAEPPRPPALAGHLQRRARGGPAVARATRLSDAPLLAIPGRARRSGHPAHPLHGPDVRAVDGGPGERLHAHGWHGAAPEPRNDPLERRDHRRSAADRPQRPRLRGRSREPRCCGRALPPDRSLGRPSRLLRCGRAVSGTGRLLPGRGPPLRPGHGNHVSPPGRHLQDGPRRGRGRRSAPASPRRRRLARRRRIRDPDGADGEHQRAVDHDRRAGRRLRDRRATHWRARWPRVGRREPCPSADARP